MASLALNDAKACIDPPPSQEFFELTISNALHVSGIVTGNFPVKGVSRNKALRLRRISCRDPESGRFYEFLTNHFSTRPEASWIVTKNGGGIPAAGLSEIFEQVRHICPTSSHWYT